ncbi:plasmid mobilization protein [Stratiformator vulcanicus]|uniref:Bacterial mobilization protein (MobC) n=1 Tax=Stratiformator vulcanicus TaxID=2527980 RepID=A0A517R1E9_9PLAN|nr:plasmid mobilization relaxosome protein MobC [Stratiformator vulcanicus]QDT37682.1 hypothetical protein Pan189_20640 [Stratiformator vulcanicus]
MAQAHRSAKRDFRPHRIGRPRKTVEELRTEEVRARLSLTEKQKLTDDARTAGLSEAEYVRRLIAGHKPQGSGRCDPRLLYELNAIGNNLNQAVRNLHAGRTQRESWEELRRQLEEALTKVAIGDVR